MWSAMADGSCSPTPYLVQPWQNPSLNMQPLMCNMSSSGGPGQPSTKSLRLAPPTRSACNSSCFVLYRSKALRCYPGQPCLTQLIQPLPCAWLCEFYWVLYAPIYPGPHFGARWDLVAIPCTAGGALRACRRSGSSWCFRLWWGGHHTLARKGPQELSWDAMLVNPNFELPWYTWFVHCHQPGAGIMVGWI